MSSSNLGSFILIKYITHLSHSYTHSRLFLWCLKRIHLIELFNFYTWKHQDKREVTVYTELIYKADYADINFFFQRYCSKKKCQYYIAIDFSIYGLIFFKSELTYNGINKLLKKCTWTARQKNNPLYFANIWHVFLFTLA